MLAWLAPILEPWRGEELSVYWPILLQGALVSVSLGLIGCFLVVRGLSLLGDALAHSVLPGIVVGFLIAVHFGGGSLHSPWILVGATAFGMLAAFLVQSVHTSSRVKEDASLGIVFTALFALGVVLINLKAGQADLDPGCVLYGNIETFIVDRAGIRPMAVILGLIVLGLVVFYRPLLVSTFDPLLAQSLGMRVNVIHYTLMAVLSLTVVTSFEAVGSILAVALLIIPGATARLWTDRMPPMLLLAAVQGIISTVLGYWLSHHAVLDTSASGAICLASFALFMLSWLMAPRHGLLVRAVIRRRLRHTVETENLVKTIEELAGVATISTVAGAAQLSTRRVEGIVSRAVSRGWVGREADRLFLTDSGRQAAARLAKAHLLWEAYLQQEVGLAADHVHDAAEWIEHHLDEDRIEGLQQMIGPKPAPGANDGHTS